MLAPRTQAAVIAGKVARSAVRALGSGGTALPGLVAERIDPDVVRRLAGQLDDLIDSLRKHDRRQKLANG